GIEWQWWVGPQECTGTLGDLGSAGGLLNKLEAFNVVRCDPAAWRFLGLSLAGYNALLSLPAAFLAAWAAAIEGRASVHIPEEMRSAAFTSFMTRQTQSESSKLRTCERHAPATSLCPTGVAAGMRPRRCNLRLRRVRETVALPFFACY